MEARLTFHPVMGTWVQFLFWISPVTLQYGQDPQLVWKVISSSLFTGSHQQENTSQHRFGKRLCLGCCASVLKQGCLCFLHHLMKAAPQIELPAGHSQGQAKGQQEEVRER